MPKTIKPRPKNINEVLNEQLGAESADPISGRPSVNSRNRGNDVSTKGDRVKDISISILDIDTSIIKYIEEKIKPSVMQDGNRIQVPIMYGFPERWQTIQEKGGLREYSGRFIAPVIVLKRDSMVANRNLGTKIDANNPQNLHVFETGYTKKNQYDNFTALTNRDPVKEYRLVVMPEYVTLTYSVVIFTNHLEQNNKITEAFQYAANTYWGESGRFQFRANIEQFATSTEYAVNEERTTRTNFTITLNGYIIPDTVNRDISYPKKYVSKAQIVFNLETDDTEIFTIGTAIKGRNKSKGVNFPTQAQTINIVETPNEALIYLSTIVTKTGANLSLPSNNTIRVLNSTIYAAPSPLPSTNKTNFEVIINSTYIPNNLVLSVTQNGSNIDIVIDTASLGYNLVTTEGMSVFGKFV
jgi:hypothetical protein